MSEMSYKISTLFIRRIVHKCFLCRTITRKFGRIFSRRNEAANVNVDVDQDDAEEDGGGSQAEDIFTVSSTENLFMDDGNVC